MHARAVVGPSRLRRVPGEDRRVQSSRQQSACCWRRLLALRRSPRWILRRMGAGAGRRQHRQSIRRRVPRHPDEPRGQPSRAGVERVALHAARVAVPAARRDVHLARAVAGPHLEGSRSQSRARSRRITPSGCARSTTRTTWTAGRVRPALAPHTWGGFSTAEFVGDTLKIHDDASEGGLLPAQRRAVADRSDADAVLDPPRRLS